MPRKLKKNVVVRSSTLVTFSLGRERLALPITDVHQIIRDVPITRVPNARPDVEGVLNLRGRIVPILDLKHRLGLGVRTMGADLRVLIVETGSRLVGFSVDQVHGVIQVEEAKIQAAPEVVVAKVNSRFIRGVFQHQDKIVILLDTREVLTVSKKEAQVRAGQAPGMVPQKNVPGA